MLRVMLIDDEPNVLIGLQLLIQWEKHNAEICGTFSLPQQALRAAETLQPDLIITDIEMPEISGLDLIASLRTVCPKATCVILSAYSDFQYAQRAVSLGVYRYLLKPLPAEELELLLDDVNKIQKDVHARDFVRSLVIKEVLINGTDLHHTSSLPFYQELYQSSSFLLIFLRQHRELTTSKPLSDHLRNQLSPFCEFLSNSDLVLLVDALCAVSTLEELQKECQDSYTMEVSPPFIGLSSGHALFQQMQRKSDVITPLSDEDIAENPMFGNSQQVVQKAMSYIRENYADPNFKLSSVSDTLFVNYSYLSHIFRQKTGKTLSNYLLELRMEEAKKLLRNSSLSVSEISYRVGYPIPKNFYHAFKKYYNESPRSYQKRHLRMK